MSLRVRIHCELVTVYVHIRTCVWVCANVGAFIWWTLERVLLWKFLQLRGVLIERGVVPLFTGIV